MTKHYSVEELALQYDMKGIKYVIGFTNYKPHVSLQPYVKVIFQQVGEYHVPHIYSLIKVEDFIKLNVDQVCDNGEEIDLDFGKKQAIRITKSNQTSYFIYNILSQYRCLPGIWHKKAVDELKSLLSEEDESRRPYHITRV